MFLVVVQHAALADMPVELWRHARAVLHAIRATRLEITSGAIVWPPACVDLHLRCGRTPEAEARRAEQCEMPEEMASKFAEWEQLIKVEKYIDITDSGW